MYSLALRVIKTLDLGILPASHQLPSCMCRQCYMVVLCIGLMGKDLSVHILKFIQLVTADNSTLHIACWFISNL